VTDDPSPDVWFALTVEVLEEFRTSHATLKTLKSIPSLTSGVMVPGPAPPAASADPVAPDLTHEFSRQQSGASLTSSSLRMRISGPGGIAI
jgi:hypothetical protein